MTLLSDPASGPETLHRFGVAILLGFVAVGASAEPVAASGQADPLRRLLAPPVVAAHRGGYFESGNPLAKIRATLGAASARVLEIDLRLTRDGIVVVSHDASTAKSGACAGDVGSFAYAELATCERAHGGEPVTRFAEVLDLVDGRAVVNAEFKTEDVIGPAIRLVEARRAESWVYFQATGDLAKYRIARRVAADIALLLKVTSDDGIREAIALHDPHLLILEMDQAFVTPRRLQQIHAANMLVSVNSFPYQFTRERFVANCDRLFSMGVDIAVTDNPSSCAAQREAWGKVQPGRWSDAFDRRRLRADFGGSKPAFELFLAGIAMLAGALGVLALRTLARLRRLRGSRAAKPGY